jgi:hypothetical protein
MTHVWIVEAGERCEGFSLKGVFGTPEAAEEAAKAFMLDGGDSWEDYDHDPYLPPGGRQWCTIDGIDFVRVVRHKVR